MRKRELGVWLDGRHVADLRSSRPGRVECRYTAEALDSWEVNTPLLSYSLPLSARRLEAFPFVTGLLPEGQHRLEMATRAGVTTSDLLGMLESFGRDVAGALVIAAEESSPRSPRVEPFTAADLEQAVSDLAGDHPLGLYDDSELSIAGLADKMLVVRLPDGAFGRPVHGAPSTHILKVDDRVRRGLVRAEHACLALARAAGLRTASSEVIVVGDAECIVVERYDRVVGADGAVGRVHQEDACQALGLDPQRNHGTGKYESGGGPGFAQVATVLQNWADDGDAEHQALLQAMVFTVAIGNADAHGKNLSFLHPDPGVIRLAPLYDTVPTALWSSLRTEAGMFIDGVADLRRVTSDNLVAEARSWGVGARAAAGVVEETLERLKQTLTSGAVEVETPALDMVEARVEALLARA